MFTISARLSLPVLLGTKDEGWWAVESAPLNFDRGVVQGTPDEAARWLVDECKQYNTRARRLSEIYRHPHKAGFTISQT